MSNRMIWTVAMTLLALALVFFVAGDFSVFEWEPVGRAAMVLALIAVAGITASCPYIKDVK